MDATGVSVDVLVLRTLVVHPELDAVHGVIVTLWGKLKHNRN